MAGPTEPRLRLQNRKQGGERPKGRVCGGNSPSPEPTARLHEPPRPSTQPATPASGNARVLLSRDLAPHRNPVEPEHRPQESWEFTCGGRGERRGGACVRGRSTLTRRRAGSRDLLIAGVTAQTGPWVLGVRACSSRVGRLKAAVWQSACVSVRLTRRLGCRREAEPDQRDWKATASGGRALR